ncbi:multidrug ABC transporter ATP-binding protein [Clostridia bacterium]|nr:multidrug ABC transporter ATP-binding protein [Clostridia bacterium]
MASIIDVGVLHKDRTYVIKGGLIMLLLGAVGLLLALVCQKSASIASQGSGTKMRSALFAHINTLSFADLDKIGTPSLINRMTNDINQIQLAVAMLIRLVIRSPFLIIGALIMSVTINVKISLIFFAAAVIIALILYLIMSKSIPFFRQIQKMLDKLTLLSRESLAGTRVIRAFGKQSHHIDNFKKANNDLAKTAIQVSRFSALLNPLTYVTANLGIICIVWFGAGFVNSGSIQTGEIIALVSYMMQILLSMMVLANLVVIFTKASASAARINEVFDCKPSVAEPVNKTISIKKSSPKIEFKNVYFSYGDCKDVLKNINLNINAGEIVGIIGTTGSGKTSLINLIPRFYDVTSGKVLIDGVNVKDYTFATLRGNIGIVPQNPVLITGTVKENVVFGKKNISDGEVNRALEISQSLDFVETLPYKADTLLVRGGKNLSGGQKQRITIARAIAGSPQILIFDDSTSALDFTTDAKLRKALAEDAKNTTVIVVSQRVASVRSANKIAVLDDGEIVGLDTHKNLYEQCKQYKEICDSQNF